LKIGFSRLPDIIVEQRLFYSPVLRLDIAVLGYVHTKPDKFENETFVAKTDKMFSVHINRFQTVLLFTLKRCLSSKTLAILQE